MIKKNLVLTVTEQQDTGEELLYTMKSVADRSKVLFAAGAPEVLLNNPSELVEALGMIKKFGEENPTLATDLEASSKGPANDPLAIAKIEFGDSVDETF